VNEDETFIRAVVDGPGDDLPRLVYADWLDDRGDPRGAYLRAECEAVESGDVARLRQLAVGLDPVWVARVSMPPIGVCVTHTEVTRRGPRVSEADVAVAERRIGVPFPIEYKAFLLNYNGGSIDGSRYFDTPDGPLATHECEWALDPLNCVGRFILRPGDVLRNEPPELPSPAEPVEQWVSRFVVIGCNPDFIGTIFLGTNGPDIGQVRVLDTSVELESGIRFNATRPPYAPSFAAFLACLPRSVGRPETPRIQIASPASELDSPNIPF
jgi:uncharacterized protein (TIGR02996 family)